MNFEALLGLLRRIDREVDGWDLRADVNKLYEKLNPPDESGLIEAADVLADINALLIRGKNELRRSDQLSKEDAYLLDQAISVTTDATQVLKAVRHFDEREQ